MTGVTTTPAARFLGLAGAFLLIFSSATLGAYYGFTVGAHQHVALGVILAAAALGGEVLTPLAVAGAFEALRSREFLHAFACVFALHQNTNPLDMRKVPDDIAIKPGNRSKPSRPVCLLVWPAQPRRSVRSPLRRHP